MPPSAACALRKGRQATSLTAIAFGILVLAGCSDLTDPADRPLVQRARLVVTNGAGSATYTVTAAGGNSPTPMLLTSGSNQVQVTWLDGNGSSVPTNGYGLLITRLSSGINYASSGLNSGTLLVTANPGSAIGELRLRDGDSGDDAFAADLEIDVID